MRFLGGRLALEGTPLCAGFPFGWEGDSAGLFFLTPWIILEMERYEDLDLLGGLSPGLAHDINTLLTPIHTYFQLLSSSPEKAREFEGTAAKNVEMLLQLIQDARIFSPEQKLQISRCDLPIFFRRAVRPCNAGIREKGIEIETDWGAVCDVQANSYLLPRLLTNIIQNSIEGEAKTIHVSASVEGAGEEKETEIIIRDDGIGIEQSNLNQVFEQSFSTKGSSGLGLAIAQKIVEIHGGTMAIESVVGEGTRVRIRLPR